MYMVPFFLLASALSWEMGPFERGSNEPILSPNPSSVFQCPISGQMTQWEKGYTFNPSAIVKEGKVYLIYRAEDGSGRRLGEQVSRIGIAVSEDGVHFQKHPVPILYPQMDDQKREEFPGGCEDPRVVETEEGLYVMTYTQWNRTVAALAIATSPDLYSWKKHGYAFDGKKVWSKSGSIVCRREADRFIATKIQGKYWMYWGDKCIHLATSSDLISWTPLKNRQGELLCVLTPRLGKFDSDLVEPGPAALVTDSGILLLYNGRNAIGTGNLQMMGGSYSAGQALFSLENPSQLLQRSEEPFFKPEKPFEMRGQYHTGAVFIQGLVPFQGRWLLYYGASDSRVGVAWAKELRQ